MSCKAEQLLGKCQSQLKSYSWITTNQKKLLIEYTGSCQVNFFVLSLTQTPLHISRLIELFLHSFFFQLYIVEFLREGIRHDWFILKDCPVKNKSKWLEELKYFKHKKIFSLKKISSISANKKKKQRTIYCITDLLIQRLFVSVLNPRVKANTELNNYHLKKNKMLIRGAGKIRNSLGYKLSLNSEMLWCHSWGMCSQMLSYVLLFKNIFVPLKHEYIFKSWLCMKQVKYLFAQKNLNNLKMFSIGLLSFLWTNSIFTGIYQLIYDIDPNFKIIMCGNLVKKFSSNAMSVFLQSRLSGDVVARRCVCWDFWWGIKSFVVLSNSRKFLHALTKKVQSFLLTQSLWIQTNICRIIWVRANTGFYFLGSIFSCGTRSKAVKKWTSCVTNKLYKSPLHRKLLFYPFVNHMNVLKTFCRMCKVVGRNYSSYKIVLVLNSILIKLMNFLMLHFQRIWDAVKSWVEWRYVKKFKIFWRKHNLFIKCFGFQNHFETLRHLTKIKRMFLIKIFFRGFLGVLKKKFKYGSFGVPKIIAVLDLSSF